MVLPKSLQSCQTQASTFPLLMDDSIYLIVQEDMKIKRIGVWTDNHNVLYANDKEYCYTFKINWKICDLVTKNVDKELLFSIKVTKRPYTQSLSAT